jgi:hypothetical protein
MLFAENIRRLFHCFAQLARKIASSPLRSILEGKQATMTRGRMPAFRLSLKGGLDL